MAAKGLARVAISVTSLDPAIARTLEPRAPHPLRRVEGIRQLAAAGVPVYASISPVIPAVTDHEIEAIVAAVAAAGACGVFAIPVRLPHEVAPLFRAWLDAHFPDRAARVMAIIREMRGGRDNDPDYFTRMQGQGAWAELMRQRVAKAARKAGLEQVKFAVRTDLFRPPEGAQMRLL
jgi:DNA repair photolyase